MKKILSILIMCLCLFSCGSAKNDDVLFLGNDLKSLNFASYLKEEKHLKVNDLFLMQEGYMSFLYSFVIQDAKVENTSIKKSIKKSKKIFIHIGTSDIYNMINNNGALSDEIIDNQKELFSYYFFLIIEEIREIYSKDIFLLSPYIALTKDKNDKILLEKILDSFFEIYEEIAVYFSCKLIDLRDISLLINSDNDIDVCNYVYQKVYYGS